MCSSWLLGSTLKKQCLLHMNSPVFSPLLPGPSLFFHILFASTSFGLWVWHTFLFFSLCFCLPNSQASLQNVKQRSAHWFQLFVLHQDGTLQPGLPDGQHQPPQPGWLFRRQRELQFNHEWPSEWTWLATSLPFCSYPWREWACPETVWRLLQHHCGRSSDQVWIHAQLNAQETVFGVRWHRLWVPLWGSVMWSLQGILQENDSRLVWDLGVPYPLPASRDGNEKDVFVLILGSQVSQS